MKKYSYYVYILSNKKEGVLYIGVTNSITRRTWEHKEEIGSSFVKKYNLKKLVYYEVYNNSLEAINREKQLKRWHRQWKINLINDNNPDWKDLYNYLE